MQAFFNRGVSSRRLCLRARNNNFALAWVARSAEGRGCPTLRSVAASDFEQIRPKVGSRVQRANAVITLAAGQQEISPGERCVCFATPSGVDQGRYRTPN
jgi:hypothetical protein